MIFRRSWTFFADIPKAYFVVMLSLGGWGSRAAHAERILDLRFWSADQSELALGGLWEFHPQTLVDPAVADGGSDVLLEISQSWRHFLPLTQHEKLPLEKGSYVLLLKGLKPRRLGYAIQIQAPESMTRVIASPRYTAERRQTVSTPWFPSWLPGWSALLVPPLHLEFRPERVDEVWMIIVQRWQRPLDAVGAVPRLRIAGKRD